MNEREEALRRFLRHAIDQHASDYGLKGKEVVCAVLGLLGETLVLFCQQSTVSPADAQKLKEWAMAAIDRLPIGISEDENE